MASDLMDKNASFTTLLSIEEDPRILATSHLMYKIGEFVLSNRYV